MPIGELAKKIDVSYRHPRYVLEEALLPESVEKQPGRGGHELRELIYAWLPKIQNEKSNLQSRTSAANTCQRTCSVKSANPKKHLNQAFFQSMEGINLT
jgi:hypothetical protein